MFLRKFKGTGPDIIILTGLIGIAVWTGSFLHPEPYVLSSPAEEMMPGSKLLVYLSELSPHVAAVLSFLFVMLIAFLLVDFNTSALFLGERTFFPALLYILLSGILPGQQKLNPALPAAIFLILAIRKIVDSYKKPGTANTFFDAGILISTGGLFYPHLLWFGFILLTGIIILRTIGPREIIISIIGLVTPLFLLSGFLYITGTRPESMIESFTAFFRIEKGTSDLAPINIVVLIMIGVVTLISLFQLVTVINAKKIKSRKTFVLLVWVLVISLAVYVFLDPFSAEIMWLIGIPVSYLISHYFLFSGKKMIPEIIFIMLFVAAGLLQVLALL